MQTIDQKLDKLGELKDQLNQLLEEISDLMYYGEDEAAGELVAAQDKLEREINSLNREIFS